MDVVCTVELSVFFFKQKTAYEMLRSLVGSEMCIRDRAAMLLPALNRAKVKAQGIACLNNGKQMMLAWRLYCLLYTSDAADDLLCVDLGGRRIIKKKKHQSS